MSALRKNFVIAAWARACESFHMRLIHRTSRAATLTAMLLVLVGSDQIASSIV